MKAVDLTRPRPFRRVVLLLATTFPMTAVAATGQDGRSAAPDAYRLLRYEEDYSRLCDRNGEVVPQKDFWDPVKCLSLGADRYLSLGGEGRLQYELYDQLAWGAAPDDGNGYLLHRYMLHADVHFAQRGRVFLQVKSGLANGRRGGPRPVDKDMLDLHQAFFDLTAGGTGTHLVLRAGRQEIALGNSRLITVRQGANVRLGFDGVRASVLTRDVAATVFVVKPAETRPGTFDDGTASGRTLIGAHLEARRVRGSTGRTADAYFFDHRRTRARFNQGIGREHRYTFGVRLSGTSAAFDYDVDGLLQRGSFGDVRIKAWALAGEALYRLPSKRLRPRLGLRLDVGSGDRQGRDPTLGASHSLYPRGPEVSEAPLIGSPNVIAIRPFLEVSPSRRLNVTAEFSTLWRESIGDGLYDRGGELLLPDGGSRSRLVGREASVSVRRAFGRHASLLISATRSWPGPFLAAVTPGRDLGFATVRLEYRF